MKKWSELLFRQKVGVLIIAGASCAFVWQAYHNARTAAKFSENTADMVINAVGGFGVELFVAAAAVGLLILRRENAISSRLATRGLIGLCLMFGLIAAAQSTGTMRAERTSNRTIEKQSANGAMADLEAARGELAKMASVPSLVSAQSAIDKLKTRKGWAETQQCANPGTFPVLCKQVADAMSVLGAANRKAQLEERVANLQSKVDTAPRASLAEGDIIAAAAARYYGFEQFSVQTVLAFFQACVFMCLAMGGWHLGLMVYGLDEAEMIRKTGTAARTDVEVLKHPNMPGNVYVLQQPVAQPAPRDDTAAQIAAALKQYAEPKVAQG